MATLSAAPMDGREYRSKGEVLESFLKGEDFSGYCMTKRVDGRFSIRDLEYLMEEKEIDFVEFRFSKGLKMVRLDVLELLDLRDKPIKETPTKDASQEAPFEETVTPIEEILTGLSLDMPVLENDLLLKKYNALKTKKEKLQAKAREILHEADRLDNTMTAIAARRSTLLEELNPPTHSFTPLRARNASPKKKDDSKERIAAKVMELMLAGKFEEGAELARQAL